MARVGVLGFSNEERHSWIVAFSILVTLLAGCISCWSMMHECIKHAKLIWMITVFFSFLFSMDNYIRNLKIQIVKFWQPVVTFYFDLELVSSCCYFQIVKNKIIEVRGYFNDNYFKKNRCLQN